MTGATIDHMVSVTILIAALMVAMVTYSNLFATAVDYDRNRQVANKAIEATSWGRASRPALCNHETGV